MGRHDKRTGRAVRASQADAAAGVIVLQGEQDITTADRLLEALEQADAGRAPVIHVDATGVTLLDSTSIGVLLFFAHRLAERGAELELAYAEPAVRRVLDASGLGRAIRLVHPSRV